VGISNISQNISDVEETYYEMENSPR
jgi:hypothetical protein